MDNLDELVLIDTSVIGSPYLEKIRNENFLVRLGTKELKKENDLFKSYIDMFQKDDVYVIPEVIEEFNYLLERISKQRATLFVSRDLEGKTDWQKIKYAKNRLLFREIHHNAEYLHNLLLKNNRDAVSLGYDSLWGIVDAIVKICPVYRTSYLDKKKKKTNKLNTDAHLVTTALAEALFDNKSVQIYSNDGDIPRILYTVQSFLEHPYYQKFTSDLRTHSKTNPVEVYVPRKKKFMFSRTSWFSFNNPTQQQFDAVFSDAALHRTFIDMYRGRT